MKFKTTLFALLLVALTAAARQRDNFDAAWKFAMGDSLAWQSADYDDTTWRTLDLPHDWAIAGDFSAANPSGASGGALPGGTAWYRKRFKLGVEAGERYFIDFDGVYMSATVYLNGHALGTRPYGYSSVRYELTPYLHPSGDNLLAVRVDNSDQPNSRWYSGCGIYRHVWLTRTSAVSVAHWGTYVTATVRKGRDAVFSLTTSLENTTGKGLRPTVRHTLLDAQGRKVGASQATFGMAGKTENTQRLVLRNAELWSVERPYIYKVLTEVLVNGRVTDAYETPTGVRHFRFDAQTGFSLNGKAMKINGVCMHHDLGCLGAALSEDALHRQLTILKAMGTNAIRCSHNPPAPELLNMCDTMGFIVMDESFDMWRKRKSKNDYARFFDQWAERDLADMVRRDRNHPSLLMWSIGNEVLEQWSDANADTLSLEETNLVLNFGRKSTSLAPNDATMSANSLLTRRLVGVVKALDSTRPVTAGCNEPNPDNHLFKSGALDIIGFNYHHQWVKDVPRNFPNRPFILTESVSALQTRGYYRMPSDSVLLCPENWYTPYTNPTFQCSAYDNCHVPWGSTHEQTWDVVKHAPWCSGQFLWTGFDYIGEPTPYGFPARSSYFGVVDLAGFPKDSYYMYQSEWTDRRVLHLFPHWNWIEGQDVDLWCYYNGADEVELFLNGKSLGVRRKASSHQYHVMWRVKFVPGELVAVARRDGEVVATRTIRTAGAPHGIRLSIDPHTPLARGIKPEANGKSLAFVVAEVVDKDGNVCPNAANDLFFSIEGDAHIAGVDNGDPASTERFQAGNRRAFYGKCLVVLRMGKEAGTVSLTAKGVDLQKAQLTIETK